MKPLQQINQAMKPTIPTHPTPATHPYIVEPHCEGQIIYIVVL